LTYMNKSGNKTIAHVYKGQIDTSSSNQLNRVVRMLQESNITFNDLLSTNMVFSKFTRDSNIAMPTAKNGNRLIEMETLEGQQIDLKTDFEDKLEQMAILGTGVPTSMLENINQVAFSRQIVSDNIRFAGRVSSLDSDLENSTTILYRNILKNSSISDELKTITDQIFFKLPRPKVISNTNNSEFLQTLQSAVQIIVDSYIGNNSNNDEKIQKIKEKMVKEIIIKNSPYLDWEDLNNIYKKVLIETNVVEENKNDDNKPSSSNDLF
jgi:hypothetical protein